MGADMAGMAVARRHGSDGVHRRWRRRVRRWRGRWAVMRWQGVSSTSDPRLAQMWGLTGVLDGGSGSRALVVVVVV
jgi:anti-sigma factor RsiW